MTFEVVRHQLPLFDEEGRSAATDDEHGRDLHYLPDLPEEDPYAAGHRTCAGCGPAIQYRWVLKAAGQDTVVAGPTGCMYVANSTYLCTPYTVPWAHTPIASGGSFTSGMAAGYEAMIRKGRYPGPYPNILVMAGDGSASDIGIGSISGALYRNHDALFVCYDNECYANTGIQTSPTTPYAGMTTFTPFGKAIPEGKKLPPKNLAKMMAEGHPHCYVATTTVGYPVDLMNKTRKGLNHVGAAFLHCYTPCQKGWVYQTSMTVELGRRVVESGLFPVWEYDPQERTYHYFHPPVQRPVTDYLAMQGRFGHMLPEHVATMQVGANRNWEVIGMDVPNDPARPRGSRASSAPARRGVLDAHQPRRRRLSRGSLCVSLGDPSPQTPGPMASAVRRRAPAAVPAGPAGRTPLRARRRAAGGQPAVRGAHRDEPGPARRRHGRRQAVRPRGGDRSRPPGRDRPPAPGTGRHVSDSPRPPQAPGKIIPLMPGISRGGGERREMLRAAVIQVVQHLVLRAVPPSRRVPLFEQATGLLDEAGWGLDELAEAAEPGPAQDALLRTLGLMDT